MERGAIGLFGCLCGKPYLGDLLFPVNFRGAAVAGREIPEKGAAIDKSRFVDSCTKHPHGSDRDGRTASDRRLGSLTNRFTPRIATQRAIRGVLYRPQRFDNPKN